MSTSVKSASMSSRARSSWMGFKNENRKHTATDSTPSATRVRAAARTEASSSGTSTSPVPEMRSLASARRAPGARNTGVSGSSWSS